MDIHRKGFEDRPLYEILILTIFEIFLHHSVTITQNPKKYQLGCFQVKQAYNSARAFANFQCLDIISWKSWKIQSLEKIFDFSYFFKRISENFQLGSPSWTLYSLVTLSWMANSHLADSPSHFQSLRSRKWNMEKFPKLANIGKWLLNKKFLEFRGFPNVKYCFVL